MDYEKEKYEAIVAGQRALNSLKEARNQISGAKSFGLWDILGGGSLVSIVKHLKIERGRNAIEQARYDLQVFSKELSDLSLRVDINISDLLTFFDLMDNFFADILVQSRLNDALRQIDDAIYQVDSALNRLSLS